MQYRIAEQLFRPWLQMRGTRRIRRNVIGLAEFLDGLYELDNDLNKRTETATVTFAFTSLKVGFDAKQMQIISADMLSLLLTRQSEKLAELLEVIAAESVDLPATLASSCFVEDLLGRALQDKQQAGLLLSVLRRQGFELHARPLLLAFEAAIEQRPEMLSELEPEVRNAAQRLYRRLTKEQTP